MTVTARPSRRELLAGTAGLIVGAAGTLGGTALRDSGDGTAAVPVPFSWADTAWPYSDYGPARTRNPPDASAPPDDLAVA